MTMIDTDNDGIQQTPVDGGMREQNTDAAARGSDSAQPDADTDYAAQDEKPSPPLDDLQDKHGADMDDAGGDVTTQQQTPADSDSTQPDADAEHAARDEKPSPALDDLQDELVARDERVAALEEQVIALENELSSTVSRYRLALLDAAPDVPGDLVAGSSAEELEASLAKARGVVEQVRARLLEGMESTARQEAESRPSTDGDAVDPERDSSITGRIPAGAPARRAADDTGAADLSARDKIALGLERL